MSSLLALAQLVLTIKDHRFTPEHLTLAAGEAAELVVKNQGDDTEELESRGLRLEKLVPAGQSITVRIGPLKAGAYDLFGDFHAATCKAELVVK
jgi:hypothetical protein